MIYIVPGKDTAALQLPSLKLTWHLKIDGWKTASLFGPGLFSGAFALSFRGPGMFAPKKMLPGQYRFFLTGRRSHSVGCSG